jgi:uncharacterized protein (DUF302 family)
MERFDYTVQSARTVDDAVAAVSAKAKGLGFGVLHIHDVQATLAAKGLVREPLRIIEVCNAQYAHEVLTADIRLALMLPCPITVYSRDGVTWVSALRPTSMVDLLPEADIAEVAGKVEAAVIAMVEAAR